MNLEQIYYCCVPDCNEVNNQHNIEDDPDFAYDNEPYGFYHLRYESSCREAGDSLAVGQDETDMDNEDRIQEYAADIGADEVSCTNTFDPNDWTYDGVINYSDFAVFSRAWLSSDPNTYPPPKDPNDEYLWYVKRWGFQADMNNDSCVDLADLELFLDNWLWQACWRENYIEMFCMISGSGEILPMSVPMSESLYSAQSLRAEFVQNVYESTPAEQVESIAEIKGFLDTLLKEENSENRKSVLEVMAVIEGWLKEIER